VQILLLCLGDELATELVQLADQCAIKRIAASQNPESACTGDMMCNT
jgi:hypothetical protein